MEVGNLAYIELMSVLFPSPVSPTTISVNSKPLFTDFLYTWWHQIWLILVSNVTALGGYWWHQIWLTLIWVETGLEGCWLLQSPNVSHHVSLIYITQPRFNHQDLAQSRTRMRLLPDWASLRIPHNHPIAVEVFSQVGPETKRKLHAGMISIVGHCYIQMFHTSGFGETSLGLGESSGFFTVCPPTPLLVPLCSRVLSWDKASWKV